MLPTVMLSTLAVANGRSPRRMIKQLSDCEHYWGDCESTGAQDVRLEDANVFKWDNPACDNTMDVDLIGDAKNRLAHCIFYYSPTAAPSEAPSTQALSGLQETATIDPCGPDSICAVTKCLNTMYGFSEECSACLADFSMCALVNCGDTLCSVEPLREDCHECLETEKCIETLRSCGSEAHQV